MSECLHFLARYDEIDAVKKSFEKLFQISLSNMSCKQTVIPNICLIAIFVPAEKSVKSVRNLNVLAINSNTARMLSDFELKNIKVRSLLKRFKDIDHRENFNFLIQLLASEHEETSWLK